MITVALTAANLRGERLEKFKLDKRIIPIEPGELVDISELTFKQDFPINQEMKRLLDAQKYSEIEWDGGG